MQQIGLSTPEIANLKSLEEVLTCCDANYLTSGLASLKEIGDRSVDYIMSNAVLEHIRKAEFLETMKELRRIIRDDGLCCHTIDLRDHLSYALNNLRFPESVWESDFFTKSGFYTNRIRYSEMLDLFRQANFAVEVVDTQYWEQLPTPRSQLNREFQHFSDDELRISLFTVRLRPATNC